MSEIVIKVENISKQYRLGEVGTGSLAHDLNSLWHNLRGKENPYLKIGETNDRTTMGTSEYVWALDDINFEVKQGEVMGIIGRNGAGKSTLLKILSKTTAPTTGSIKIKGRVASLLEVGTGFHPELSGRDNIFLNGAILGMTKNEIKRKFDEIVAFSGVERYIDTPVKRYSSGMYVRLAFAVAAHLEPEILIVDEVLAVGDAEFQKKCLGKMKDVSDKDGRTVLFVSHNLQAVSTICSRGLILQNGKVFSNDPVEICIQNYFGLLKDYSFNETTSKKDRLSRTNGKISFTKAISLHEDGRQNEMWTFRYDEPLKFYFECKVNQPCDGLIFYMALKGVMTEVIITNLKESITQKLLVEGEIISFQVNIPAKNVRPGQYDLYFAICNMEGTTWYDVIDGNINLPALIITPISDDPHENIGYFTVPYSLENREFSESY
jgi:lipopolysaccharide transport system ATP-binding protein